MAKKEDKRKNKIKKDKQFWYSMIILILMVTSIAGFALMMTSGSGSSSVNNQGIPKDYPLKLVNYQNQTFWIVIKNYQQFVFDEIDSFQNDLVSSAIANKILNQTSLNIYISKNSDYSALYLLEKLLDALNIEYTQTQDNSCVKGVLYISTPSEAKNITGECIKFIFPKDEQYNKANAVVYYALR